MVWHEEKGICNKFLQTKTREEGGRVTLRFILRDSTTRSQTTPIGKEQQKVTGFLGGKTETKIRIRASLGRNLRSSISTQLGMGLCEWGGLLFLGPCTGSCVSLSDRTLFSSLQTTTLFLWMRGEKFGGPSQLRRSERFNALWHLLLKSNQQPLLGIAPRHRWTQWFWKADGKES